MIKQLTQAEIAEVAKAGAEISKYCKRACAGFGSIQVRFDQIGRPNGKRMALHQINLIDIANVADLQHYQLAKSEQQEWLQKDWHEAIRQKMEYGDYYRVEISNPGGSQVQYFMKLAGYRIEQASDGGYWLRQGQGGQSRYYRHKSSAIRRAQQEMRTA